MRAGDLSPQQQWVHALALCESGGRDTIKVFDSNKKYSYGRLQFQAQTWLSYSDEFGTSMDNIYDGELQEVVATYILNNGGYRNWLNCSRAVSKKLGPYPVPEAGNSE